MNKSYKETVALKARYQFGATAAWKDCQVAFTKIRSSGSNFNQHHKWEHQNNLPFRRKNDWDKEQFPHRETIRKTWLMLKMYSGKLPPVLQMLRPTPSTTLCTLGLYQVTNYLTLMPITFQDCNPSLAFYLLFCSKHLCLSVLAEYIIANKSYYPSCLCHYPRHTRSLENTLPT